MRLNASGFILSLLGLLVAACDGDRVLLGDDGSSAPAAPSTDVEVVVARDGVRLSNVLVYFHDASGAIVGETVTDASGRARTATAHSQLTVYVEPRPGAAGELVTYTSVSPGDRLLVDVSLNDSAIYPRNWELDYHWPPPLLSGMTSFAPDLGYRPRGDVGGSETGDEPHGLVLSFIGSTEYYWAPPASRPDGLPRIDAPPALLLGVGRFGPAPQLALDIVEPFEVIVDAPLHDGLDCDADPLHPRCLSTTLSVRALAAGRSFYSRPARAGFNRLRLGRCTMHATTWLVPPARVSEGVQVVAAATTTGGGSLLVERSELRRRIAVDRSKALPPIAGFLVDPARVERPALTWTAPLIASGDRGPDGIVVRIRPSGGQEQWTFLAPPNAQLLVAPELPPAVFSRSADHRGDWELTEIAMLDRAEIADFRELKASRLSTHLPYDPYAPLAPGQALRVTTAGTSTLDHAACY